MANEKSEMMDMTKKFVREIEQEDQWGLSLLACDMIILCICPLVKQVPLMLVFHAASMGRHCMIHRMVSTTFDTSSIATAACRGRMRALVAGIRIRKRQMEILVHISVANVWIHSP